MTKSNRKPPELSAMTPEHVYTLGTARYVLLRVDQLKDANFHTRSLRPRKLKNLKASFNRDLLEAPIVNFRDGAYFLIEGYHRREVLRDLHVAEVVCRVIEIPEADEPAYATAYALGHLAHTPLEIFVLEVDNKNPAALEIVRVLGELGLRIANTRSPDVISAINALRSIYARGGVLGLSRALRMIIATWPSEPRRFEGKLLLGMDVYLRQNGTEDPDELAPRLAHLTPTSVLARADERWHAWRALDDRGSSRVDAIAEVIQQAVRKGR